MTFHDQWRLFLNESTVRQPLTEEEIALIAEGRVDDVIKKYPNVERYADRLAGLDPSKNNKYLMWMMKQIDNKARSYAKRDGQPDDAGMKLQDAYFGQLLTDVGEIGEAVEEFHKNIQRIKNKDINSYKTLDDLQQVNKELGFSQRQKKKGEKMAALEDVEVLIDNDYFILARPYTVDAAAVLGGARDSTSWCIARGQCGDNWFNKYTGEGKAFYYIISKHLNKRDTEYLNAITITRDGEIEEIHDRENTPIDEGELEENIRLVLFAGAVADAQAADTAWNNLDTDEPTPKIIQKVATSLVEEYGSEYGEDAEDITDSEEVFDIVNRIISSVTSDITAICQYNAEENPAGPKEEDYQEVLNEYESQLEHAYISFDDDYFAENSRYYWSGGMSFELPDDLEWVDGDIDDYEEEISEIFSQKADDNHVYPEEIEFDTHDESLRMEFRPTDYDETEGVDGFKTFCENVVSFDKQYDVILEEAIEEIHEQGLVRSESYRTRLQQFEELPEFRNFESILEKGIIKIFTKFDLDLNGFLEAIKYHELIDNREPHQIAQAAPSVTQNAYLNRLTNNVEREIRSPDRGSNNSVIGNDWIAEMAMVFTRASKETQKQMELPLQEGKKWEPLGFTPTVQFLAADIQVSPKERVTGTILFEFLKKEGNESTEDTIRFISWVDQHFVGAMDVLAKSIMQTAKLRGITAKKEEPQLFQQGD